MDGYLIFYFRMLKNNYRALFTFFYGLICDFLPLLLINLMYSASYQKTRSNSNKEELLDGLNIFYLKLVLILDDHKPSGISSDNQVSELN